MSLPELFHHENLFVGCLSLRRVNRHKQGQQLIAANTHYALTSEDIQQFTALRATQLFNANDGHAQTACDYALMTQAIDYPSSNQCPALGADNRCTIHDRHKPALCGMVPFDALYPDPLQHIVLLNRRFDADCIVTGNHVEFPVVIKQRQIVSDDFENALSKRREALCQDKQWWGNTVFSRLQRELLGNSAQDNRIPANDELLSFSIIPALQVVASISETTNTRCLQYVDSQLALIDAKIAQALARKSAGDKKTTRLFRSFRDAYLKFRPQLLANQHSPSPFSCPTETEDWLKTAADYLGIAD